MITHRHVHLRPPRRSLKRFLLVAGLCLAAGACQERLEAPAPGGTAAPTTPHPLVERDLAAIRQGGVLRLITRYDSNNYFIHKGGQAGFDYELVERFAREQGLTVGVVLPGEGEDMISLLNQGKGDVVAAGLIADPGLELWVALTRPTNFVQKVVVLPANSARPATLAGLAGLTVTIPWGDPSREDLQKARDDERVNFFIGSGRPLVTPEELVAQVARGELDAVVVDDIIARTALTYLSDVRLGPLLGERRPTTWLVRQNAPDLRNALNTYLADQIRVAEDGRTRRSQTYGIIYDRYFQNPLTIRRFRDAAHRPDKSGTISAFDDLIRRRTEALGLDWRIVAAQIYQESRFYPFARSRADARGLMQVLPKFAGVQADSLYEPTANLTAGLRMLRATFDSYAYLDSLDRWRFTLAEYHAGHGHLTDARRIAMEMGRDPNQWKNGVAHALPKLLVRRYFENTRHGFYDGAETVKYVDEILNRARMYSRLVARQPATEPMVVERAIPARDPNLDALPELITPPDPK